MKLKYTFLAVCGLTVSAQAAIVVTTANQLSSPYAVSSTDLLNGLTPVAQSGNFNEEGCLGTPALTNGTYSDFTVASFASGDGSGNNGKFVTYLFSTTVNVSSVNVYGGWGNNGRDAISYSLEFSTNGGATFGSAIPSGLFNPVTTDNIPSATKVSLSDDAGNLATGVNAIRINFLASENGFSGYSEIDVIGAIPEPSSLFLMGLGGLAAMGIRRRK